MCRILLNLTERIDLSKYISSFFKGSAKNPFERQSSLLNLIRDGELDTLSSSDSESRFVNSNKLSRFSILEHPNLLAGCWYKCDQGSLFKLRFEIFGYTCT